MKNRLTIHYIIAIAAFAIVLCAAYLLYQEQQHRSLWLTIVACSIVGVGQILIIRQKKSGRK